MWLVCNWTRFDCVVVFCINWSCWLFLCLLWNKWFIQIISFVIFITSDTVLCLITSSFQWSKYFLANLIQIRFIEDEKKDDDWWFSRIFLLLELLRRNFNNLLQWHWGQRRPSTVLFSSDHLISFRNQQPQQLAELLARWLPSLVQFKQMGWD